MAQKDITEKMLEDYKDVFADIVNVLIFDGEEEIQSRDLEDTKTKSQYKADDSLIHEQERDVSKIWKKTNVRIAMIGLENQTAPDAYMPLRVMGYDGSSYRSQLIGNSKQVYPVLTLILYFGTDKWQNRKLYDCFSVPKKLQPFVSDYHINVFEIAKLKKTQVAKFKSDFKFVADYFYQTVHTGDYKPSKEKIKHVDEVLKLLQVMSGDDRFVQEFTLQERKRGITMDAVVTKFENRGVEKGMKAGKLELLFDMVKDGTIDKKKAAEYAGISAQTFGKKMKAAGYM